VQEGPTPTTRKGPHGERPRAAASFLSRHFTTERKVSVGFAIALAFLGTIGIVSYLSLAQLNENSRLVAHSQLVISSIDALVSTTFESETAQRGYLLTGDEPFAAQYTKAAGRVDGLVQQLRDAVSSNPAQIDRVAPLAEAVRARLKRSEEILEVRRRGGFEAVQEFLAQSPRRTGALLQAHVTALAQEMKADEIKRLNAREEDARRSATVARIVIVGGSSLALVFVAFAIFAIRRDFAGRLRAEMQLREAKDELEVRVIERTRDLAESNEEIKRSERRFRALIEHSTDAVTLIDQKGQFQYASPAIANIEGFQPEELVGRNAAEGAHPDDAPEVERSLAQMWANPGKPIPGVWRRRHKSGRYIWIEGVATNLLDDPSVRAVVTNYRDITERLAQEARLNEQLQRLALLARITHAIGERQDVHSIFQAVVARLEEEMPVDFCCIFLYDSGEDRLTVSCVGHRSADIAHSLGMAHGTIVPIDENGLSRCVRGQLVYEPHIATTAFPFPTRLAGAGLGAMVIAPLLVESQVFGVLVCARKQADSFSSGECEFLRQASEHAALAANQAQLYAALQKAYNELQQTQEKSLQQERLRALGQMASGIAHDINNAISPVTLYTEALLEREQNLSERARDYLEIIQRAVDDVAQTVARMGEFYRQREPQVSLQPVDLNKLVRQVVDLTRARWSDMAQQRGVAVDMQLDLAGGLPPVAAVDGEIREALVNLVFNAVDAMPQGGPLTLRTRVVSGATGQRVVLEVVDGGVGMDEETRRRCLEPFFTTKGTRGTGLGLAMVYGVAQRHGATLDVESELGKGTLVRLGFNSAAASKAVAASVGQKPTVAPMRVLIVDDDPLLLKSLRDTLEGDGHQVTAAGGGQAGINAFMEAQEVGRPFPVVITDLGMPHVDGRKVASTVKARAPGTLVLMLTGWGRRMVEDGEAPASVDRVLSKPPKIADLREALANYFARKTK
jgi:PAS domain S-box-containing protein